MGTDLKQRCARSYQSNLFGNFQGVVQCVMMTSCLRLPRRFGLSGAMGRRVVAAPHHLGNLGGMYGLQLRCLKDTLAKNKRHCARRYNLESNNSHVADVCAAALNSSQPLAAFAAASSVAGGDQCIQNNWTSDVIEPLTNITFDGESSMRQWIWQSCNEFGFFQTTTGASQPFASFADVNIDVVGRQLCQHAYGIADYAGPNTVWAATYYGGRKISAANVTFPNGNMVRIPWPYHPVPPFTTLYQHGPHPMAARGLHSDGVSVFYCSAVTW